MRVVELIKRGFLILASQIKKYSKICGYTRTILSLLGAVVLFYGPAIVMAILGEWVGVGTYISVWAGPGTPAMLVIALIAIGLMIITSPKTKRAELRTELGNTWQAILKELDNNLEKIKKWIRKKRGA